MKRFLSLALSLVMCFGLMIPALAIEYDYPDIETDKNVEAIDILSTLGIISGFDDGGFHPNDPLTRAQAATLITRAMYGGSITTNTAIPWADVAKTHWARPYIDTAYLYSIMSGYGGWRFGPDDSITYVQMGTIMLNGLGYGSSNLGSWPTGQINKAEELKLFTGITITDYNSTLTRAEAARVIYNAFEVEMVEWTGTTFKKLGYTFFDSLGFVEINPILITSGANAGHEMRAFEAEDGTKLISNTPFSKVGPKIYCPNDGLNYGGINTSNITGFTKGISTLTVYSSNSYILSNNIVFGTVRARTASTITLSDGNTYSYKTTAKINDYILLYQNHNNEVVGYDILTVA